jgi:hypothetical protein
MEFVNEKTSLDYNNGDYYAVTMLPVNVELRFCLSPIMM